MALGNHVVCPACGVDELTYMHLPRPMGRVAAPRGPRAGEPRSLQGRVVDLQGRSHGEVPGGSRHGEAVTLVIDYGCGQRQARGAHELEDVRGACAPARLIFGGWGNEKLLEDSLQKCRDHEQRDPAHKLIFKTWEIPHSHKMVEQYGREEVKVNATCSFPVPPKQALQGLFSASKEDPDGLPLRAILKDRQWTS